MANCTSPFHILKRLGGKKQNVVTDQQPGVEETGNDPQAAIPVPTNDDLAKKAKNAFDYLISGFDKTPSM